MHLVLVRSSISKILLDYASAKIVCNGCNHNHAVAIKWVFECVTTGSINSHHTSRVRSWLHMLCMSLDVATHSAQICSVSSEHARSRQPSGTTRLIR